MRNLEVCVDSIQAAEIAVASGATRIELCAALEIGGVSPSVGFVEECLKLVQCPVVVLVRCRGGDFVYSAPEQEAMLRDVRLFSKCGIAGIAVGAVTPAGQLDEEFARAAVHAAKGAELIFHRAFDAMSDPMRSMEQLIELGFRRILTSGGADSAWNGREQLRSLISHARGRIEVLPAGGVSPNNAQALIDFTGCSQLHGSFRKSERHEGGTFGKVCLPMRDAIEYVSNLIQKQRK